MALIVVQDDALRDVIAELLDEQDFSAVGARTLDEASQALEARLPELMVIEPGVHNAEDLRAFLREHAARRRLPATIVLTDRGSVLDVAAQLCVVCVRAPFDLDDFAARVRELADAPAASGPLRQPDQTAARARQRG